MPREFSRWHGHAMTKRSTGTPQAGAVLFRSVTSKCHVKVKRLIRKKEYRWAVNEDFRGVMEGCAERESTWISGRLIASFEVLHEMGHAHSVEIFRGDRLVAGLYGATLRSAFFAESMFQREPEMGKLPCTTATNG